MSDQLQERKQKHLDICLDKSVSVESGDTRLSEISLKHRALPEIHAAGVSLATGFLGYMLKMPVMISCMTGGSEEGRHFNNLLARIAGDSGLAIGTGSIRVMLRHTETTSHFELKKLAPEVPVLANIGAAQLVEYSPSVLTEAVKRIGADALYVHLNPAQELFQDDGDRDFTGWYDGFRRLIDAADIPVLVKETGAGIPPLEGLKLLEAGVSYIDVSGTGGTDWVAVESARKDSADRLASDSFRNWGYPTGELLLAYRQIVNAGGTAGEMAGGKIIASGGLRSPRDFAVSLACGAAMGAAAMPFIRAVSQGGEEAVYRYIAELETGIRAAVVLTGSGTLANLRNTSLRISRTLAGDAEELAEEALREEGGG